jgi:hypothetical protein
LKILNSISAKNYNPFCDICFTNFQIQKNKTMGMNKNTILGWATLIMVIMGFLLIGMGAFKYDDVAGWGFVSVGIGFLANAWVFNALKGRL